MKKYHSIATIVAFVLFALLWRIYFGLGVDFWEEDGRQIYLLGLRWYTTGELPYFGPDVIHSKTMLPGALQAFLVGLPLHIFPVAEAPIVFVNILSVCGLLLLANYLARYLDEPSLLWIFAWLSLLPWTLEFSAHVYNPSYCLFGACVFFVSFLERLPVFTTNWFHPVLSYAGMGFALLYLFQLHLSWPLLLPFFVFAVYVDLFAFKSKSKVQPFATKISYLIFGILVGAAIPGLLLIPTIAKYGFGSLFTAGMAHQKVNLSALFDVLTITARLLSFSSFEFFRFIGSSMTGRVSFLLEHWWLVPTALILGFASILQPLLMCYVLVKMPDSKSRQAHRAMRMLLVLSVVGLSLMFALTDRPPLARNFFIFLPLSVMLAAYLYKRSRHIRGQRTVLVVLMLSSFLYHSGLAWLRIPKQSLYTNRELIDHAIANKDAPSFGTPRFLPR